MYLKSILIGVIGVVVGIFLLQLKDYLAKRKLQSKKTKTKRKAKKIEFSKIILALVLSTYFLGIYAGFMAILSDPMQLSPFLVFIGTPTTIAIGFYSWKAKAENIVKIKRQHPEETEGVSVDLNNITP